MSVFTTERPNSIWVYLFDEHRLAAALGWQRLFRQPYQTLGAIFLMTLSLSLLTIFGLALHQAHKWQKSVDFSPQVTIFSKNKVSTQQVSELSQALAQAQGIVNCAQREPHELLKPWMNAEDASLYAQKISPVFTAEYPISLSLKEVVDMKSSLEKLPYVEKVEVDMLWHAKVTQAFKVAKVVLTCLGAALISCVIVIINYSVKLFMDRYQQEIAILYHLGAASDFIQRPYIYQGFFLGLFGALGALSVLAGLQYFFNPQIQSLLQLYECSWSVSSKEYTTIILSLIGVVLFAVISAILSIQKWLSLFEHERLA